MLEKQESSTLQASSTLIEARVEENIPKEFVEFDLTIHVFTVSATLVGVCLTVIGIFSHFRNGRTKSVGEDLLAFDALLFLVSCVLSYTALKKRGERRRYFLETTADNLFLAALTLMTFICGLIVYEIV